MHLVTVATGIPNPATGGGGNWNSSLIHHFVKAGHRVSHIAVMGKYDSIIAFDKHVLDAYQELGVEVIIIPFQREKGLRRNFASNLKALFRPTLGDFWPDEVKTQPLVSEAVEKIKPDCILPFAFDAVLFTHQCKGVPRVGVQAEGPYINIYVQWRYNPAVMPGLTPAYLLYTLRTFVLRSYLEKLYVTLTGGLTIAAFQGPHYVAWAEKKGLANAVFVTTPTPDPAGSRWRELRDSAPKSQKCRILMIGHLYSTSNRSALPIFFHEILPTLEKEWGKENYEIHIVGRNDLMPARFDSWRNHPALIFRGPVYPADQEFLSSDILLVPVPAKTGSRVRIINGFSYGCCVVAHSANTLGIPELKHEENILLGDTGKKIARQVIRAANDPGLRKRLGESGRKIYEQFYTEAVGGEQYLRLVERAVATWKGHATPGS